jgi:hypothetical protein
VTTFQRPPANARRRPDPVTDPRSRLVTQTAASLAQDLARLRFDGLVLPRGGTRLVTRAIVEWAERLGWLPVTEMALEFLLDTPEYPGRQGIVDLYIARPGYKRDLVIEIDRGNKGWSAAKLGHCVAHGKAAIWVRWSGLGPPAAIVPGGVEVIYLDVGRRPRVQPAAPVEDLRVIPPGEHLSGATRALLAALYPVAPPEEDDVWKDEKAIWARVGELRPRLALIVRCRFGAYGPRPLTLNRTAEVVADELDMDEVTRERIRQLQARAMRMLRAKSMARVRAARKATGLPPPARQPRTRQDKPSAAQSLVELPYRDRLPDLVLDVVRAVGEDNIRASMVCHVLRGSDGPATRRIVARHNLPHDGALGRVEYRPLLEAVLALIAEPPFRNQDGYVRLRSAGG